MKHFTTRKAVFALAALVVAVLAMTGGSRTLRTSKEANNEAPREQVTEPQTSSEKLLAGPERDEAVSNGFASPAAYTRQLVATLTNLDLSQGPLGAEEALRWK